MEEGGHVFVCHWQIPEPLYVFGGTIKCPHGTKEGRFGLLYNE